MNGDTTKLKHAGLRCPRCLYRLDGLDRLICPECGTDPHAYFEQEGQSPAWARKLRIVLCLLGVATFTVLSYAIIRYLGRPDVAMVVIVLVVSLLAEATVIRGASQP